MRLRKLLLSVTALAGLASSAHADVIISFNNFSEQGASYSQVFDNGQLGGTLTGISIQATLMAGTDLTFASDLSTVIVMDLENPALGFPLQVGGYNDFGADEYTEWETGQSADAGVMVSETYFLKTPLAISAFQVWLGNGYIDGSTAGANTGTWSGTVTLLGVSVPDPMGLAAMPVLSLALLRFRRV